MQIEPNELHNISDTQNTALPTTTPQHGLLSNQQHSADLRDHLTEERPKSAGPDGSNRRQSDSAEEQLSRLNVSEIETRPKPSFQQISEYESALSPSPKKQDEGPVFKVIRGKGNRLDAVNLENCPNGKTSFQILLFSLCRMNIHVMRVSKRKSEHIFYGNCFI